MDEHLEMGDMRKECGSDSSREKEVRRKDVKKHRKELENKMDEALAIGDLDDLKILITPKNLAGCKNNCIEKSFEVSHKLKSRADAGDPDAGDLRELETSVESFAIQLLEHLREYYFNSCCVSSEKTILYLVDKAVKYKQKKILSHSVFYNLLMMQWGGYFGHLYYRSTLKWFLLNVWTFFDVFLFPLFPIFLGMIHLITEFAKKRQDLRVVYIASRDQTTHDGDLKKIQDKIKSGMTVATTKLHQHAIIYGDGEKDISNHLQEAEKIFEKNKEKSKRKKVIVFMDDKTEVPKRDFLNSLTKQGIMVIFVFPPEKKRNSIKELETIARCEENVSLIYDVNENDILEHIKRKDIYELYVQYFETPYFIFLRDILSFLVLLGLHFAMCLQPSTIHFTLIEWIIAVFFLGRLMMEIHQLIMGNLHNKPENTSWTVKENKEVDKRLKKLKKKLRRIFSRYFYDWWNRLDVVILIVYFILVGIRIFIWSQHFSVPKNRLLADAGYLYGLNAMFLTLRVFGTILEAKQSTGLIQIALFHIMSAVITIFGQFLAATVGFSLAITKIYIAEVSYNSGKNSTSIGSCGSQNTLECWWSFLKYLGWSLLGFGGLTPLESSDSASDTLARILYVLFLIMGVVMLMNMMIALLSNTYKQAEDNAFHEWTYKKTTTILTYKKYHTVPVPFNIISLSFILLGHICKCKRNKGESIDDTEQLKWISEHLPKEYFAVHGYAFPIVDKKQSDLVFKETKGNRIMNEWIIQRIFCYNQHELQRLKANGDPAVNQVLKQYIPQILRHLTKIAVKSLKKWEASGCITTSCQRLELSFCDCGDADADEYDYEHGARFCVPLSEEFPKFEVLVAESGVKRVVGIGVVPANYKLYHFPGWKGNSAGYHIDDGKIFDKANPNFGRNADDAMAFRGDIIGCKILYEKKETNKLPVSFTLNGRVVGESEVDPSTGDEFYPYVGIVYTGVKLIFRFCLEDTLPREDPELQMLETMSEEQQKTNERLTELEHNMYHLSRSTFV